MSWPCRQARNAPDIGDEEPRSALAMAFSRSYAIRRHRPSHARVRSTTHPPPGRGLHANHERGRDDLKALCRVRAFDDLRRPAPDLFECPSQFGTGISAIGKSMAQQRAGTRDGLQQGRRAVTILDIGTVNGQTDRKPGSISDDATFAPLDPLAGVIASDPRRFAWFSRPDCRSRLPSASPRALRPDAPLRRAGGSTFPANRCRASRGRSAAPPETGGVSSGRIRPWQPVVTPSSPGRRDVEDRINDIAQIGRARPADPLGRGHQRRDQPPFRIARIACVSATAPLISAAGEFSPGHGDLRSVSQPNRIIGR